MEYTFEMIVTNIDENPDDFYVGVDSLNGINPVDYDIIIEKLTDLVKAQHKARLISIITYRTPRPHFLRVTLT
jgi:hypothetical protein